jgi:hypothetical protein
MNTGGVAPNNNRNPDQSSNRNTSLGALKLGDLKSSLTIIRLLRILAEKPSFTIIAYNIANVNPPMKDALLDIPPFEMAALVPRAK